MPTQRKLVSALSASFVKSSSRLPNGTLCFVATFYAWWTEGRNELAPGWCRIPPWQEGSSIYSDLMKLKNQ